MTEAAAELAALSGALAMAAFRVDGTIVSANEAFIRLFGYEAREVIGGPHAIFVAGDEISRRQEGALWAALGRGETRSGEFRRLRKNGGSIWIQATYVPIIGTSGRPIKIVQHAHDITPHKTRAAEDRGQIAAIDASHGVIHFALDGTILDANRRFLDTMGYRLDDVRGQHHRMFVEPACARSAAYADFWSGLAAGTPHAGEYRRIGRNGRELWLQATYHPIHDIDGRPCKVVKHATDVTEAKLRQADHHGQIVAIRKSLAVIEFKMDGTILYANDTFLEAVGYRLEEVEGRHHRMFVDPSHAHGSEYATFWANLAKGRYQAAEFKRLGKDGREVWLQATYNPIFDLSGRPFKVVKYATDVTDEKIRQADYEGQIAAINKSQFVVSFDMDGTILDANDNCLAALGYRLSEIKGQHHRIFVEPSYAVSDDYRAFWETLRAGTFHTALFKRIGKDGRELWIQASYNPILDWNGRPFKVIKFATDVTSEVALADALNHAQQQAQHDVVTALPNRVRLANFMEAALAEPLARLAVLYLDLDRFKPINDTFGHHAGDRVLGEVADRLRRALPADQIVARVGGDEFVVAAPNLSDADIEALCQTLLASVAAPIRHDDRDLTVSLSIGVAVSPVDADTPDDLLRCADVALYRSKAAGRGTYSFFTATMNDRILAQRHLAGEMRRGLAEGEFFVEYQPRFHARTRIVRSVEALVRWAHPERGRIDPAHFIPLAEKSGLIVSLGAWVLRTACHAATAWPGIGVSVNVSPVQFRSGELTKVVGAVLSETRLQAGRLELEITEGVLLEDEARAHAVMADLKALGVTLAMDDFGTGYSSFSTLRNFPFDVLKIDQQFIADLETREGGRSIVQAILGLGKALGIAVTAEGVETPGQLLMLTLDECAEVQGFLLARPMSADAVTELLSEESHRRCGPGDLETGAGTTRVSRLLSSA